MDRFNFMIEKEQMRDLKKLPGTMSEHVRIAILRYLDEIKSKEVSSSQSKRGDSNE